MSSDPGPANPAVKAVIDGTAPRPARLAAARGILPLPQIDLLYLLVKLAAGDDPELAENARRTLASQETSTLEELARSNEIAPEVLAHFAVEETMPHGIHEAVIRNVNTPPEAIAKFAQRTANGALLELLSFNQQLLIRAPAIIDAITGNSNRTPEAERRALEVKREFFEKERGAQQIASELRAQGKIAAAEFIEHSEFAAELGDSAITADDALFFASHIEVSDRETDDSWLGLEYLEDIYEETEAQRQAIFDKIVGELSAEDESGLTLERISTVHRIMQMGVKDRVQMAMKGDREARNILIRDNNRLVARAVANNPRITEQEIEMIASMRSVTEDVLRDIAASRQWSRSYPIILTLVKNPRTPIANAMTLLNRIQLRDLSAIAKNRNVSDAVRRHALRLSNTRTGSKN